MLQDKAIAEENAAKAEVASIETMVVPPEAETDILKSIQAQLARMVQTLKSDEHVHPAHVSNAEKHVSELVLGFTQVLQQAGEAKERAAKIKEGIPPCRMHGKQTLFATSPLPKIPVHRVRHLTKRPLKTVPADVFAAASRRRLHGRSRSRGRCHSADAF